MATRMSIEQYVKITDWLKANKERIRVTKCTQGETASLASTALGFAVPLSSVQKCAKFVGIKWAKSPSEPPFVPLEREAIIILIGAIAGLYVETGRTVPNDLANLQSGYVREEKDVRSVK